jgi:hypothetical protein
MIPQVSMIIPILKRAGIASPKTPKTNKKTAGTIKPPLSPAKVAGANDNAKMRDDHSLRSKVLEMYFLKNNHGNPHKTSILNEIMKYASIAFLSAELKMPLMIFIEK